MSEFKKDELELGALWSRTGAKGEYLTGSIEVNGEVVKVVCFSVKATSEKSPTWRVLKSVPRDSAPAPVQSPDADEIGF